MIVILKNTIENTYTNLKSILYNAMLLHTMTILN